MKRKVISLLLLVVMLSSQFSVVFAEETNKIPSASGFIELTDYLIDNGVDENDDGALSDEEWAKVKTLQFHNIEAYIDVTGIEKAVNLKTLDVAGISNISDIDFSKLIKLERLTVSGDRDEAQINNISNATSIKELYIECSDISNIDFSKLTKLEYLQIDNEYGIEMDYSVISNATNLKDIYLWGELNNSISNINFSKLQKLESIYIQNNTNTINIDLSGLSGAVNLTSIRVHNYCDISNVDFSKLTKLNDLSIDTTANLDGAVNLRYLSVSDNCDISSIDFSKLQNLEDLYIGDLYGNYSEINLPSMNNLKYLSIFSRWFGSVGEIDLSRLNSLVELRIESDTTRKIYLPKLNNIENINLDCVYYDDSNSIHITDYELNLENCGKVLGEVLISNPEKLKLNNDIVALSSTSSMHDLQTFTLEEVVEDFSICKGVLNSELLEFNNVTCEENNILEIVKGEDGTYILGKIVGTHKVSIVDALGRTHEVNVTVFETPNNNVNKELEDGNVTAEFVDLGVVLKSNGELWDINSETTAEKIDTNVKDYDWGESYTRDGCIMDIKNKLKFDNTLEIDISGFYSWLDYEDDDGYFTYSKTVQNVKEIGKNVYLTENGDLIEIYFNSITDEINLRKVKENVKRLIGDCVVLEDGTTWCQDKSANDMEGIYDKIQEFYKVADFEIKDAGWYSHEGTDYWCIVDLNNNLYGFDDYYGWLMRGLNDDYTTEMTLLKENFDDYYCDGNVFMYYSYCLFDESVSDFMINGEVILNNIARNDYWGADALIRTDGSLWLYSEKTGLTKITKSTVIDDEEDDENKPFLSENSKIKEKEVGEKAVISGVSKNLTVQEFNNQNNFSDGYQAKVFDKSNKEITGNAILGTGSKVRLYDDNKLVKEYVVVIYGDTTGDGKITAVDALALIKHINNKILFTDEVFSEAGRVRPNSGTTLTSVDALAIIKGVNGKFTINQYK